MKTWRRWVSWMLLLAAAVGTSGCIVVPYDGGYRHHGDRERNDRYRDQRGDDGSRYEGRGNR